MIVILIRIMIQEGYGLQVIYLLDLQFKRMYIQLRPLRGVK